MILIIDSSIGRVFGAVVCPSTKVSEWKPENYFFLSKEQLIVEDFPVLMQKLASNHNLSGIIVNLGPGDSLSIRSVLAFLIAFSMAKAIPLMGINAFDALSLQFPNKALYIQTTQYHYFHRDALTHQLLWVHESAVQSQEWANLVLLQSPYFRVKNPNRLRVAHHLKRIHPYYLWLAYESGLYTTAIEPLYIKPGAMV